MCWPTPGAWHAFSDPTESLSGRCMGAPPGDSLESSDGGATQREAHPGGLCRQVGKWAVGRPVSALLGAGWRGTNGMGWPLDHRQDWTR